MKIYLATVLTLHLFETKNLQNRLLLICAITKLKGFIGY